MTDEQQPDQASPEPPEGSDSGVASENELDEVLAQASSLAAELSEEIGAADELPVSEDARRAPEQAGNLATAELDAQLNEIDRLVAETNSEVDDASGRPDEHALPPSEPPASPSAPPVPEFMEEFTRPERPGDAAQPGAQAPASGASTGDAGPKPGVVGTGMLGVVGAAPPALEEAKKPPPSEAGESGNELPGEMPVASKTGKLADLVHWAAARSSPVVLAVCDRALTLLEVVNRPVADKLGDSTLRVIGWIALATLGTSVIVYLFSLL